MIRQISFILIVLFINSINLFSQEIVKKDNLFFNSETGEKYSGTYVSHYENGEKSAVYTLKEGLEHGKAEFYYNSGEIMEQGSFRKGKKDGRWVRWAEDGTKLAEAYYNEGVKDGKWLIWDERGIKRYEMYYQQGSKTGEWIMWDEKGQIANKKNFSEN